MANQATRIDVTIHADGRSEHEVVGASRAHAHPEVEALLDQVDDAVGKRDVEAHLGVARHELCDRGGEVAHAEVDRGGEPDRAARLDRGAPRLLLGFIEVREELHRPLVERAPAFGQADAPGGASRGRRDP